MLANEVKVTLLEDGINTVDKNVGETHAVIPALESGISFVPPLPTSYRMLIALRFFLLFNLKIPACGRVIRREFASHELPSLIEIIFSSKDEGNTIRCLLRNDAQSFIDAMNEVRSAFAHNL